MDEPENHKTYQQWNRERMRELRKDPVYREQENARRRARNQEKMKDPVFRAKKNAKNRERMAELRKDPVFRAKQNAKKREWAHQKRKNDPEWYERERAKSRERGLMSLNYRTDQLMLLEIMAFSNNNFDLENELTEFIDGAGI